MATALKSLKGSSKPEERQPLTTGDQVKPLYFAPRKNSLSIDKEVRDHTSGVAVCQG